MDYRHEYKFLVPDTTIMKLKYRLEPLMRHDDNQEKEFYRIRSLYFDDIFDSCYNENLAGTDIRRKYRIRYYNDNTEYINLEKKSKFRGMTRKVSEKLTMEEAQSYIDGDCSLTKGPLTAELYANYVKSEMKPKCIVEYDRCALIEDVGNVRITFDTNIRGSKEVDKFFDFSEDFMVPALEPGFHVLEVKYDEFLPTYIREVVDTNDLHRQSVSKYGLVRQTMTQGGKI